MEPRDVAPNTAKQPSTEPQEATSAEPDAAATLPCASETSSAEARPLGQDVTGREFFALAERVRSDGGPLFDSIELAPVAQIDAEGTCEAFESLDDVPDELRGSVFWSIYGHTPGEGVQCIGDFTTPGEALEVLERLFGDLKLSR
jgi:hypothetical protein